MNISMQPVNLLQGICFVLISFLYFCVKLDELMTLVNLLREK